ncbi:ESPR-type extended signal peptide-containing protein [Halomonas sp. TD01]|uniref:ESPR-type extended signal peptide-containing protein n=2 Tax=Halomonas sp. TD01 TaxID=999141 RepID=UPI001E6BFA35|nr:ESPR-type extended signal peptide-containing protein [Halomonas sp. TD01]CAH1043410.1 hypothetical protein HPTD01_1888 [Halomonas sp. TD01]
MNNVFRLIWNRTLGRLVVASEAARSQHKSGARKSLVGHIESPGVTQKCLLFTAAVASIVAGSLVLSEPSYAAKSATLTGAGAGLKVGDGTFANDDGLTTLYWGNPNVIGLGLPIDYSGGLTVSGAVAIGTDAEARSKGSVVIGANSIAESPVANNGASTVIGAYSYAGSNNNVVLGNRGVATGWGAMAIGRESGSLGRNAISFGNVSAAIGDGSVAMGQSSLASGPRAIAIGSADSLRDYTTQNTQAIGTDSLAFGTRAVASQQDAVAFGRESGAAGVQSVAIGTLANAAANRAVAIGSDTQAELNATAIGDQATSIGERSTALGFSSSSQGNDSVAVGNQATATGVNSLAMGKESQATGTDALALGTGAIASGDKTISIGFANEVSGTGSGAIGDPNIITGAGSYALGNDNTIDADEAGAFGNRNILAATADGSRIIGNDNNINVPDAMVVGNNADVTQAGGVALGSGSVADTAAGIAGYVPFGATAADTAAINGTVATQAAVDIGSRQITSVAAGTELDDAVNVSQLVATQTSVAAGTNVTSVAESDNPNGGTIYTINADGASVSAGSAAVDVVAAVPDANNVTDYAVDLSQASKDSLTLADSALQDVVTQVDGVDVKTLTKGDNNANFVTGKNMALSPDGAGGIEIATLDNVTFTDVKTDTLTAGPVNIGATGIDAGNTTISGVAPGVAGTDAVNLNQLDDAAAASKTEVAGGSNIASVDKTTGINGQDIYTVNAEGASVSAGSGAVDVVAAAPDANNVTDYAVDLSQASKDSLTLADSALQDVVTQVDGVDVKTLTKGDNNANFVTGKNMALSPDGAGGIEIATLDNVTFTDVKTDTLTAGPVNIGATGIDAGNTTISGVAPGVAGTDAVNLNQLDDAAAASKTEVAGGSNIASVDKATGINGQDIYTVNAEGASVSAGSGAVDVVAAAPDANNVTDYAVDLSQASKDSLTLADSALQDVVTQIDGTAVKTIDQNDNVANFISGDNIELSDLGGAIEIATSPNLTADSLTITNGPTLNDNGIDMGGDTITNVGAPINGGDAVNLDYFDENRTRYYSVNDNGVQQGNYDNDGATGINALAAGTNALADGNSSLAMGDGARTASTGEDQVAVGTGALAGGNKSVAIGQGARAATDLFDGGIEAVAIGSGASAQGTGNVALGSDSVADGSTLATAAYQPLDSSGNPIAVAAPTATSEVSVGTVGDERRIINVAAGAEDTDAVNVSQLKAVNELASAGWDVQTNGDTATNVAPGDTVQFIDGKNIDITRNGADITVATADSVVFDDVTITGGPTLTGGGIDMNNTTISNLADGVNANDAVNLSQLEGAAAASKTEVAGGTNVASVDKATGINGQDIYTVNADGASVSAGSGAVDVAAAAPDANNVTDYAVDLSQASKDSLTLADSALQTVVTQIDGTVVKTIDQNDNVANFISGDNIELSDLGGAIEIATSPNLTADSLAITNGPTLNDNGIDMGGNTITNLGDPVNAGDALNLKYFDENRTRYYSVNDDGVIQGNYENDGATGVNAMAAGVEAISTGENNTAVGFNSQATGANDATAVGANALASAPGSTSLGQSSTATGSTATAIGTRANASGSSSSAIGSNAQASGTASVALGRLANAAGEDAVAIGNSARSDYRGTAVGPLSEATGDNATATGFFSKANGYYAASYGSNSKAEGDLSLAMGGGSQATAANSVALGSNSLADGSTLSTAAYQPLDGEGNPIAVAAPTADSEVSVGSAGNERRITNVAAGATDTDAVNVSQLKAVNEVANTGWNVQANGDTATNVAPGDTVQFIDGKNIDITRNGADITVATADSVVFDDVTITGGPTLTSGGIDMNATTISNLADGVNANDAVNLSQLENSAAASKTEVAGGTNVASVDKATGVNGQDIYTVNADGASVSAGSGAVDVTAAAPDANNITDYAVDLSQASKDSLTLADSALQTVVTQIDGTEVKTLDQNDNVANFVTGDNIVLSDEAGGIKIATSPDLTADSLTINNGGPTLNDNGIDMNDNRITNVGEAVDGGDAINLDYFDANRTRYYSVNDGGTIGGNFNNDGATGLNAIASGVNATASGDGAVAMGFGASAPIRDSLALGSGSVVDRALAPDSGFIPAGSATIEFNTTDKELLGAISVGDSDAYRQITNVADGTQAQDAVTVRQLQGAVGSVITTGIKYYRANSDDPDAIAAGEDSLAIGPNTVTNGDNGIGMGNGAIVGQMAPGGTAIGNNAEVLLSDGIAFGTNARSEAQQGIALGAGATVSHDQSVALGSNSVTEEAVATSGVTIAGDSYTFAGATPDSTVSIGSAGNERTLTNVAAGRVSETSTDAINGSQLFASNQAIEEVSAIANTGWDIQTNGDTATSVAPGDTVQMLDGQNIAITRNGTDITIATVDSPQFGNVTVNTGGGDTINGLSNTTFDPDNFTSGQAASEDQLKQVSDVANTGWNVQANGDTATNVAPGDTVQFIDGKNIDITRNGADITVATADSVVFDDVTITGGPTLTGGGIDMNATTISNLADGVNAQDAVNVSQLEGAAAASRTEVIAGTNVASVGQTTGADGQDIYTVNADGASVSAGSGAVDVTAAAPDANNVTDYAVDLSQASKDSLTLADSALQTVVTQIDGTEVKTLDQNDNVANFISGNNIELSDDNGAIEIATSADLTADSLTINNGGPTLNDNGIDMNDNRITNVGEAVDGGDAINLDYFDANRTRYYSVNDGGTIGGNFNNDGATGLNAIASGVNATASGDGAVAMGFGASAPIRDSLALGSGSVVDRALAPDSGFIPAGSATIEFNTTDKELLGAISVGDSDAYRQITNVADGTQAQDAVTVRQLQGAVGSVITTGIKYYRANSDDPDAIAAGEDSLAIGPNTVTNGDNGIGMGNGAIVGQMAPGGTAIGNNAEVLLSDGIAFGTNARSEAQQGIALGAGATVSHDQSVALGSNSVTEEAVATSGVTIAGDSYTFAGATPDSTVSIGSAGNERTLTNVAAGRVSETSTDAINGSQLFASNQAIEEVSAIANTGWDIQTNGDTATSVAPGDTVQMLDGQNIAITRNGTDITIATVDSPQFGNVTVNTGGGDTINGLSNTTFDPDNFTSGQAASEDQLKQVSDVANTGWNVQTNGDAATNVAPGDTVQFIDGKNIDITRNGADITVATADSVVFDDVTITGGPTLTGGGIDMNATTISNLADGVNANDAVNLSQLENSAAASKTEVAGGTNVATVDKATGVNGQDIYTVNADGASVSAGSGAVDVTAAAPDANNVTDYAVDLSQASKDSLTLADSALQTVVTQIDGTEVKTLDQNDNVANFISGNNIELSDDNGAIEIATSADLTADSLTINNGGPTLNDNGIDMNDNRITNVGEAVDGGDAINLDYFDANRTRYYSVNDGGTIGGNFNNDGATGLNAIASGVNATASGDGAVAMGFGASAPIRDSLALGSGSVVDRALAPDSGFIPAGSATIEFNTTDKELLGAISVGDDDSYRQITNVADGTEAQDAVTVRQLQGAVGSVITTGIKYYRANSDDPDAIAAGEDSLAIGPNTVTNGDNGIGMGNGAIVGQMAPGGTAIGNNAEVLLSDGIAFGTNARSEAQQGIALGAGATVSHDQSVALGSNSVTEEAVATSGVTIAGDSYTFAGTTPDSTVSIGSAGNERTLTNVAAGRVSETSTDAINGSQLFASNLAIEQVNAIANTGWNVQTNGDIATNVAPGDTVQFLDGKNVDITRSDMDITVATADDVAFDSAMFIDGPTINGGGIDMNNTTISNLADGVNAQDAVNLSQLQNSAAASKTEVAGGTNVTGVDQTIGADGQAIYTVNADSASVSAGSGAVDVTAAAPDADNITDYAVDLSQASKDSLTLADSALQTVVTQIDGTNVKTLDQNDNVANFISGQNVELSDNGGAIEIATSPNLTADSLTINNGPTLNGNGIDMGGNSITNLGDPVNDGDALNLQYFNENRVRYFSVNDNGVIGGNFNNDGATGLNAMASGVGAIADGEGAVAMGFGANALVRGSLAIGSGSVSDRALAPESGFIPAGSATIEFNTTDKELLGAISVGDSDSYRQIINVADGTEA